MSSTLSLRLAAACGLLYPVTMIAGDDVIARGDRLAPDAGTPSEVAANVAEVGDSFFYGRALGLVGSMLLMVFAAYVATRLRRLRGPDSIWPSLALGAGVVAATLQIGAAVFQLGLAQQGGEGIAPEQQVLVLELGFGFVLAMLPLALLVAAIAVEGVHGRIVGKAVGRTGAVLAAALFAGFFLAVGDVPLGFLPLPLSWLWFLAAGISAARRVSRPEVQGAARVPA